jgi:26S proteasome regulatory subunit N5
MATSKAKKEKMQQDFSGAVAEAIPKATETAKQGKLTEAVESLLQLEKQTRLV